MLSYVRTWLPLAVGLTGLCLGVYGAGQQIYRQSANDPQIQMTEDTAALISSGAKASSTVPKMQIDIAASLATFIVVYDATGTPIASSGTIDGRIPVPPAGVFVYAANNIDDRLTLEPQAGVRIAAVVKAIPGQHGFVMAGRNLRAVEDRVNDLGNVVLFFWTITMIGTFLTTVIVKKFMRDQNGYIRMNL